MAMTDLSLNSSLARFAWLSIAAAILTIALKAVAYILTGSVGLLSDALESCVNLVGAVMALAMLVIAARPADEEHAFGHSKAEYFSSGVEGALILIAAVSIAVTATQRLLDPKPLEQIGLGLAVSVVASLVNLAVSLILSKAGKRYGSVALEADARHLMTDVWTSGGVLVGVGAVAVTGWERLDPIVAYIVAGNIIWSGVHIMRGSVRGLMDSALPAGEQRIIQEVFDRYRQVGVQYHAIRTRQAGTRRFVSFHVIVPGEWTVHRGHQLMERLEADLRGALSNVTVLAHLEPLSDPAAWKDAALDRTDMPSGGTSDQSSRAPGDKPGAPL